MGRVGRKLKRVLQCGERFGWLRVIRAIRRYGKWRGSYRTLCRCQCGRVIKVNKGDLVKGRQVSCGCWSREQLMKRAFRHGHARIYAGHDKTPEYHAYTNAKTRCNNENVDSYYKYGGSGVRFLFTSFTQFLDALKTPENPSGLRPAGMCLDRIDSNWHYGVHENGASNIRWTTWQVQNNPARKHRRRKR
jgi:hypothetical protein